MIVNLTTSIIDKLDELGFQNSPNARLFFCVLELYDDPMEIWLDLLEEEDVSLLTKTFLEYKKKWLLKPEYLFSKKSIIDPLVKEIKRNIPAKGSHTNPCNFDIYPTDKELKSALIQLDESLNLDIDKTVRVIKRYYEETDYRKKLLSYLESGFEPDYLNYTAPQSNLL